MGATGEEEARRKRAGRRNWRYIYVRDVKEGSGR